MLSSSAYSSSSPSSSFQLARSPSPSPPLTARTLCYHRGPSASPAAAVVAASSGGSASVRPWILRGALGSEPSPPAKPQGFSIKPPPSFAAGSKPDHPILIESNEIPSLDEIINQSECQPDPVYLVQSLKDQRYVCVGPKPSPFCITHRMYRLTGVYSCVVGGDL